MHLTFHDKQIRDICEVEKIGRQRLGDLAYSNLQTRLADLMAAKTLEELPIPPVEIDSGGVQYRMTLTGAIFLVLRKNKIKKRDRGTLTAVSYSLQLMKIEGAYEKHS